MKVVEESMLSALNNFPNIASLVRVPHLYFFDHRTNTQVLEDIAGVVDLKTFLVSPASNIVLSRSAATSIGHALGTWLRYFHSWTSAPSQAGLRVEIGTNEPMRKLKYRITYDSFITVLEQFPEVLGDNREKLTEIKENITRDFNRTTMQDQGEEWGIIHGDFWTGK